MRATPNSTRSGSRDTNGSRYVRSSSRGSSLLSLSRIPPTYRVLSEEPTNAAKGANNHGIQTWVNRDETPFIGKQVKIDSRVDDPVYEAWNALILEQINTRKPKMPTMRYEKAIRNPNYPRSLVYDVLYSEEGISLNLATQNLPPSLLNEVSLFIERYSKFAKKYGFMHNDLHANNVILGNHGLVMIDLGRAWIPRDTRTKYNKSYLAKRLANDFAGYLTYKNWESIPPYETLAHHRANPYLGEHGYVFDLISFCMFVYMKLFLSCKKVDQNKLPIMLEKHEDMKDIFVRFRENKYTGPLAPVLQVIAPGCALFRKYAEFISEYDTISESTTLNELAMYAGGFQCTSKENQWRFIRAFYVEGNSGSLPAVREPKYVHVVRVCQSWFVEFFHPLFKEERWETMYTLTCTLLRYFLSIPSDDFPSPLNKLDKSNYQLLAIVCLLMTQEITGTLEYQLNDFTQYDTDMIHQVVQKMKLLYPMTKKGIPLMLNEYIDKNSTDPVSNAKKLTDALNNPVYIKKEMSFHEVLTPKRQSGGRAMQPIPMFEIPETQPQPMTKFPASEENKPTRQKTLDAEGFLRSIFPTSMEEAQNPEFSLSVPNKPPRRTSKTKNNEISKRVLNFESFD